MPAPTFTPKTARRTAAPTAPARRAVKLGAHTQGASSGMPHFARTSQPVAQTPTAKTSATFSSKPATAGQVSAAKMSAPTTIPATPEIRSRSSPPTKSPLPRPLPSITSPSDRWEREAHRFADFTARSTDKPRQPLTSKKLAPLVAPVPTQPIISSTGTPLPSALSRKIENATGHNVSAVRVHDNKETKHAAQTLKAHAFTVGTNIYLGPTANPSDPRLLAHETAHTLQQSPEIRPTKPALKSAQTARGPPRAHIEEKSAPQLSRAPHAVAQRLELSPFLPLAGMVNPLLLPVAIPVVLLGSRSWLTRSLQDTLDHMLSGGLFKTLSFVTDRSLEILLSTFALKPGHFSWPLEWFRGSLPIIEYSSRAQDLLSGSPQDSFADSLRGLSQMLRAVFNGNWRWLAESFTATQLCYAHLKAKIGTTLSDLGAFIGQAHLGRCLDKLADDLRTNTAVLDRLPALRADVADILGFIDFNSPTGVLVTWVESIRSAALHAPTQLRSIAKEIVTLYPEWTEPLKCLFSAMEPAMTDENTEEVKPPFLIRALRKLGVPEELLSQLQANIKSLSKALKHPFKFFRNLTSAIVKSLHKFAGNIARHQTVSPPLRTQIRRALA